MYSVLTSLRVTIELVHLHYLLEDALRLQVEDGRMG